MDWTPTIFSSLIALSIAAITWFIVSSIEKSRRERERLQDERRNLYMQILEPYIIIFDSINEQPSDNETEQQTKIRPELSKSLNMITSTSYRRKAFKLILIGSDKTILSYNKLVDLGHDLEHNRDSIQNISETIVIKFGELLLSIRKDLVGKRTKLTEIEILKGHIRDLNTQIELYQKKLPSMRKFFRRPSYTLKPINNRGDENERNNK